MYEYLIFARILTGQIGHRGQTRQSLFDQLKTKLLVEKRIVDLVKKCAAQIDQTFRFRSLKTEINKSSLMSNIKLISILK